MTAQFPEQFHLTLPDFTPVPRRMNRGDVWTEQVQRAFIEALADTGSVETACRIVGRSPSSAYRLRRHPLGAGIALAWQVAIDIGIGRIEDYAMDRALNGVEVPVYYHGEFKGTMRRHHEALVMFMLRNRLPHRYCDGGAKSLNAIDKRVLARLKQEWLAERMREEDEDEQDVLDGLDRQLETMRLNRWNNMSPRARAAYAEAERIAKEDGTEWMLDEIEAEEEDGEIRIPLPPPREEAAESDPEGGPRVRTLKDDDEW